MQLKKKTVALVEPAAGNVDPISQKSILAGYADKHKLEIDLAGPLIAGTICWCFPKASEQTTASSIRLWAE